ncbi:carboxypeptidase-like regulatory domain-containing protein [Vibrio intestinalis]|uniref:carboxypeptidase-like regulatory domain-containing protein n=1 Tax=Vibrio intestinalis TaxID=2933291 RepID=UPI0021A6E134|nr:carboxypeptidase-like regulatory domain-containing protein [Vibrio intestinalis]
MKHSLIYSAIALSLAGCGSDSTSNEPNQTQITISGTAISSNDVLANATVCLVDDLFSECSQESFKTTTDVNGQYTLNIAEDRYQSLVKPTISVTPLSPTTSISATQAEVTYAAFVEADTLVSPLTTKIVDEVRFLNPVETTDAIVADAKITIAENLQINVQDLNSNYIQENDSSLIQTAQMANDELTLQAEATANLNLAPGCTGQALVGFEYSYNHHLGELIFVKYEGTIQNCTDSNGHDYTEVEKTYWKANPDDRSDVETTVFNWFREKKTWLTETQQQIETIWKYDYSSYQNTSPITGHEPFNFVGELIRRLDFNDNKTLSNGYTVYDESGWHGWDDYNRKYDCPEGELAKTLSQIERGESVKLNNCIDFFEKNEFDNRSVSSEKVQFFGPNKLNNSTPSDPTDDYNDWTLSNLEKPYHYEERESSTAKDGTFSTTKKKDWSAKTFNTLNPPKNVFNSVETNTSFTDNTELKQQHNPQWGNYTPELDFGLSSLRYFDQVNPSNWKSRTSSFVHRSYDSRDGKSISEQHYLMDVSHLELFNGNFIETNLPYLNNNQKVELINQNIQLSTDNTTLTAQVDINHFEGASDTSPTNENSPFLDVSIEYTISGLNSTSFATDMTTEVNGSQEHRKAFTSNVFNSNITWNVISTEPVLDSSAEPKLDKDKLTALLSSIFKQDGSFSFNKELNIPDSTSCDFGYRDYITTVNSASLDLTFEPAGDLYFNVNCNATGKEWDVEERVISAVIKITDINANDSINATLSAWDWGQNIFIDTPVFTQELTFTPNP